jgi:glutathione S-transferase
MPLTFHHGHGSPYSWRVFLALEHLRVPYELKVLSFAAGDTKKPGFAALNPRHQVPTIVDDGFALWESIPILEYLDERYGQEGATRLYPGTEVERARIRRLVKEMEEYLGAEGLDLVTSELFFKGDAPPDAQRLAQGREKVGTELLYLEKALPGTFFGGESPCAADFVLAPSMGYVNRITARKPETKLSDVVPAGIAAWHQRIQALPFYDKTFPPHWK